MKRLFIEVSKTNDYNRWELESSLDACQDLSKNESSDFWWKVVDNARFEENLFQYISEADEIFMSTSIMPLVFGTDIGSPELWDAMLRLAIKNKITNKKVHIDRTLESIHWSNLNKKLLDKAFTKNYLYVASDDNEQWEQVDIDSLLREKFK